MSMIRLLSKDGDLVPSRIRDSYPALHRFPLCGLVWQNPTTADLGPLTDPSGRRMHGFNLGVGGSGLGLIGRRMSLVDGERGSTLAEGVIGWN